MILALAACVSTLPASPETEYVASPGPVGRFTLEPGGVGPEALVGHWSVVAIGWLRCPDVCPAALTGLAGLLDDDPSVDAWFVSIDPERDREHLVDQVAWYHPAIRALTADPDALGSLVATWGLAFGPDGDGYEHSTAALIVDPSARIAGYALQPSNPDALGRALDRARAAYRPPAELWMRRAPPTASVHAAFGVLHEPVLALGSPGYAAVELHETVQRDGVARMVPRSAAPAGTRLEPGGWHVMLHGPRGGPSPVIELTHPDGLTSWVRPEWR